MNDGTVLTIALEEARAAATRGEVPVGAVLVKDDAILAQSGNRIVEKHDPTAHAEIEVIRAAAAALENERLFGTTLYVTLEPCVMCAGAIAHARIGRVVYAATDPKGGAIAHGPKFFEQPTCHHHPEITQVEEMAEECGEVLRDFFRSRRAQGASRKNKDARSQPDAGRLPDKEA